MLIVRTAMIAKTEMMPRIGKKQTTVTTEKKRIAMIGQIRMTDQTVTIDLIFRIRWMPKIDPILIEKRLTSKTETTKM